MTSFPYTLTSSIGDGGTLGLIVLQVDETIEHDFRRIFSSPDVALYITRIRSGAELNPDTIAQMELDLPAAASLLPPAAEFDAVGYACTSGTTLIGPDKVADLIKSACKTRFAANPLTAAFDAMRALDVRSFGLVSPYIEEVASSMKTVFEQEGFSVPASVSFGEEVEARVARIDPVSIRKAAIHVSQQPGVEAIFLSCTNLRTLDLIEDLEQELDMPVISSNLALAWQMASVAGIGSRACAPGRLFRTVVGLD